MGTRNVYLLAASKESPLKGGDFAAKIAQMHVLDILSTVGALRRTQQTFAALERTAQFQDRRLY
ncbi:MAG: hypothetical protein IRZ33_10485 [Alicyclobacillaceae bacterium]|nr:hypothetical protein [Alicyclobacillaceae bacterium]